MSVRTPAVIMSRLQTNETAKDSSISKCSMPNKSQVGWCWNRSPDIDRNHILLSRCNLDIASRSIPTPNHIMEGRGQVSNLLSSFLMHACIPCATALLLPASVIIYISSPQLHNVILSISFLVGLKPKGLFCQLVPAAFWKPFVPGLL